MYIDRIAVPCISTESRIKTNGDIHDPLYFIFFLHFEGKERFARRITRRYPRKNYGLEKEKKRNENVTSLKQREREREKERRREGGERSEKR